MAGKHVIDKIQLGNSGNAANNFLISTLNNGTLKIQRGNDGGALTDVMTIDANGKMISAFDIAAAQLNLTANGYAKLPNGLIIQWGSGSYAKGAAVSFPIAFPTVLFTIATSHKGSQGDGNAVISSQSLTSFTPTWASATTPTLQQWFAIGY